MRTKNIWRTLSNKYSIKVQKPILSPKRLYSNQTNTPPNFESSSKDNSGNSNEKEKNKTESGFRLKVSYFLGGGIIGGGAAVSLWTLIYNYTKDLRGENRTNKTKLNEIDQLLEKFIKDEIELIPIPRLAFNRKFDHIKTQFSQLSHKLLKLEERLNDLSNDINSFDTSYYNKFKDENTTNLLELTYLQARINFLKHFLEAIINYKNKDYNRSISSLDNAESVLFKNVGDPIFKVASTTQNYCEKFYSYIGYIRNIKGLVLRAANKNQVALEAFLDALSVLPKHDPAESIIIHHLASSYSALGRHDIALMEHCRANSLNENEPFLLNSLAFAFFQVGRFQDSENYYLRAIRANPHPVFITNRVWLLLDAEYEDVKIHNVSDNIVEAKKALSAIVESDYKLVPYYRAIISFYEGDFTTAISDLRNLKTNLPNFSVDESDDNTNSMLDAINETIEDIEKMKNTWQFGRKKIKPKLENSVYPIGDRSVKNGTSNVFKNEVTCLSLLQFSSLYIKNVKCPLSKRHEPIDIENEYVVQDENLNDVGNRI